MSEMKPIAWAIPHHMPNDTYPHCELVLYREQAAQNTLALYTAEQLAEAVAAEREKNLVAVEGARIASDGWGDPIDDGDCERNEGIDLALSAIRSAAK